MADRSSLFRAWPAESAHLSGGLVHWSWCGTSRVTAVIKAAYRFSKDSLVPHEAPRFAPLDQHHGDANTHVVMSGDAVPRRERVDVTALGHANIGHANMGHANMDHAKLGHANMNTTSAPSAVASTTVRLAVLWDDEALIDRVLNLQPDEACERIPLTFEQAVGGAEHPDNPLGSASPAIVDPREAARPASFGPIAATWPCRSSYVGGMPPPPGWTMSLPDAFDWQYFQAAPPDQQLTRLEGDETVLLEGFAFDKPAGGPSAGGPAPRRIVLPGLRARGVLFDGDTALPLDWRADALHVDADHEVMTLSWRAERILTDGAPIDDPLLVGGVAADGLGFELPARRPSR